MGTIPVRSSAAEVPAAVPVPPFGTRGLAAPGTGSSFAARGGWRQRSRGARGDFFFSAVTLLCALTLPAILLLTFATLASQSQLSFRHFGFSFLMRTVWNPVTGQFGAPAFVLGTLATSVIALLIAAPAGIATAVFVTEICPPKLRGLLSFLTDLLAAIPSVVYGLWALLVLVPAMRSGLGPALERVGGWTGLFRGPQYGVSVLTAGLILAVMIFPVVSSVGREVMRAVPDDQREAVLALGATRWEMISTAVLRNARVGLTGALILGLGRALGETMAVAMVIGDHAGPIHSLLAPGYSIASVIANEFAEASGDLHLSALMELGLLLLLVTTVVNAMARLLIWIVRRPLALKAV